MGTNLYLRSNRDKIEDARVRNCFISYGALDVLFVEKLVKDLELKGVTCWVYCMDSIPGKETWKNITEARRKADKMIVICSENSLTRPGVKREIQEQIAEDEEKIIPILLDDILMSPDFDVKTDTMDLKPSLLDKNYVDFRDELKYNESLDKLYKGIRR